MRSLAISSHSLVYSFNPVGRHIIANIPKTFYQFSITSSLAFFFSLDHVIDKSFHMTDPDIQPVEASQILPRLFRPSTSHLSCECPENSPCQGPRMQRYLEKKAELPFVNNLHLRC